MRVYDGPPLDRWIAQRPSPSFAEKMHVLARVSEAVAYLHANGVLHRDLKPSNILIERHQDTPRPIIVDFGTAVLLDADSLTKTADSLGTLGFIAPEIVKKGASLESRRSILADIYSLGALTYFTLFREKPVQGEMTSRHFAKKVDRLTELDTTRRQFLVNVLAKATALEPTARYESAEELAEALMLCLPGSELPAFEAELPFVDAVFEHFDQIAPELKPLGFVNRRFDEYEQIGRYTRLKEKFSALALYDFDMKEFASGFSFPTFRIWHAFEESSLPPALRAEFGKEIKFDPPNKAEEGGAYVWFNVVRSPKKDAGATARHLLESLRRCLVVYAAHGFKPR